MARLPVGHGHDLLAWVALVYGRFAVGSWLLSLVDADNRWVALVL